MTLTQSLMIEICRIAFPMMYPSTVTLVNLFCRLERCTSYALPLSGEKPQLASLPAAQRQRLRVDAIEARDFADPLPLFIVT